MACATGGHGATAALLTTIRLQRWGSSANAVIKQCHRALQQNGCGSGGLDLTGYVIGRWGRLVTMRGRYRRGTQQRPHHAEQQQEGLRWLGEQPVRWKAMGHWVYQP